MVIVSAEVMDKFTVIWLGGYAPGPVQKAAIRGADILIRRSIVGHRAARVYRLATRRKDDSLGIVVPFIPLDFAPPGATVEFPRY